MANAVSPHSDSSMLRRGALADQDRVLDIAIALELLYALGNGEITYKLATRAGWYIGTNLKKRLEIRKDLTNFYASQSLVVHGSSGSRGQKITGANIDSAFEIARQTPLLGISPEVKYQMVTSGTRSLWANQGTTSLGERISEKRVMVCRYSTITD